MGSTSASLIYPQPKIKFARGEKTLFPHSLLTKRRRSQLVILAERQVVYVSEGWWILADGGGAVLNPPKMAEIRQNWASTQNSLQISRRVTIFDGHID